MGEFTTNLIDIHNSFALTDSGRALSEMVRYEKYKSADITNDEWVKLLGSDVNNLSHLHLTYGLTRAFIKNAALTQPDFLNEEEQKVLQVAALIHDWAEAIVGDISYDDKTADDVDAEQAAFEANVAAFYKGDAEDIIHIARTEVIFNKDSKLGQIFNAIERVGYLRTALRASGHLINGTAPSSAQSGLTWLVANVLSNQTTALIEHSATLKPVEEYLKNKKVDIDNAFALVAQSPDVFQVYRDLSEAKSLQFHQSLDQWMHWRNISSGSNI